jgi:hypothetical protein
VRRLVDHPILVLAGKALWQGLAVMLEDNTEVVQVGLAVVCHHQLSQWAERELLELSS